MYQFDPKSSAVEETFRSIALSQIDEALEALASTEGERRSIVHEARRRCKKLRGLLRLVRPAFPGFQTENAAIRDAAALLSHLRDAEVLHETIGKLAASAASEAVARISARLSGEPLPEPPEDKVTEFRLRLLAVRERAAEWTLRKDGPSVLLSGLREAYKQDRERMAKALANGDPVDFHDWRKSQKYHGFHVDLLRKAAPDVLEADLKTIDKHSDLLGVHHDLAVLLHTVDMEPARFGGDDDIAALREAIDTRRKEIEEKAASLGRQLLAERPRALARRFARYWKTAA
ncbi:MAG: CHAD domain-containing protein [Devosia sp.]